jgi:hypothetical protein
MWYQNYFVQASIIIFTIVIIVKSITIDRWVSFYKYLQNLLDEIDKDDNEKYQKNLKKRRDKMEGDK